MSLFSACCIGELAREGVKEGDIIEGIFHPENNAIDIVSGNGVDCVAWLGITCEEVSNQKDH